jgi:hypothetical protein
MSFCIWVRHALGSFLAWLGLFRGLLLTHPIPELTNVLGVVLNITPGHFHDFAGLEAQTHAAHGQTEGVLGVA